MHNFTAAIINGSYMTGYISSSINNNNIYLTANGLSSSDSGYKACT